MIVVVVVATLPHFRPSLSGQIVLAVAVVGIAVVVLVVAIVIIALIIALITLILAGIKWIVQPL